MKLKKAETYPWKFASVGGTVRVKIQSGADIANLYQLDRKMWTVLSCPTEGLEFNSKTLSHIDIDKDGRIRVDEVIRTSQWLTRILKNPDILLNDKGELAFIANPSVDRLYKELFLMANKAYLRVNPSDAEVLTIDGYTSDAINKVEAEAKESTSIYTLTGNRVPNGAVLRPGVYIQNGKKRLIK